MNIFPSFILLIHVTFSYYLLLLSVFVYYIVTLYTLPILNFQISNCNVFVYVTLAFLRYPIVTVFVVTTFATRSVSNIPQYNTIQ